MDCATVNFTVNGKECSVGSEIPSNLMLVDYLRYYLKLYGTKFMCKEAGCGACIVAASKTKGGPIISVNSCVVPVLSCNNWEISTIESVGNKKDGYHPIQKTLAKCHGTQCGYCSPGWVMAMYSLLQNSKELTMLDIENAFGSNICRCTGYRPILDAFKQFAKDSPISVAQIEDLHICDKSSGSCCKDSCIENEWCLVKAEDTLKTIELNLADGTKWYVVPSISELFKVFVKEGTDSYTLAAGNTSKVPYPLTQFPKVVIDISCIPELREHKMDQNLVIGAGLSLTEMMDIFTEMSQTENFAYLKKLNEHMNYVAHIPIRNLGTVGGNLCIKHEHNEFASDMFLIFNLVGAQVTIKSMYDGEQVVTMEEFLKIPMKGKVMMNVMFPPLTADHLIETYKVMTRYQAVHAIVNAGFMYQVTSDNVVTKASIVYGSINAHFDRATKTEQYLVGKSLFTNETLQGALAVLEKEVQPTEHPPEPAADLRKKLALRLFYKGLLSLCPTSTLHPRYVLGAKKLHDARPVSQGKQIYDTNKSLYPLNEPVQKIESMIQCAGEAKYTDDLPAYPHEVYASLVLSTVAVGDIVSIDPTPALAIKGVIAFFSAKDIPGENTFTPDDAPLYSYNEEALCSGAVKYFNQPLGVIVAETQAIADSAALLVEVKYKNVRKPVLTIDQAKDDTKRTTLYLSGDAKEKGTDVFKTIDHSIHLYGQYHFPIETIACSTNCTEEGIECHVSTQWVNGVQVVISRFLNIDESRIDVNVRRVGGSYGLKVSRSGLAAVVCSLVSFKLNRPCRLVQSMSTNMKAYGKRLPNLSDYKVSVNSTGVVQHNDMKLYEDNGYVVNEDFIGLSYDAFNNCYDHSRWSYKLYNVITDTAKNTWCRAPGTLELIANAELMMERISYELELNPVDVRLANLDTKEHGSIKDLYETLRTQGDYEKRRAEVDEFNQKNRWRKRGLRFSFMRWTPITAGLMEVSVSVFSADGSVAIQHGAIEMGQGVNTKAAQICAHMFGIPLEKIQVKSCNSNATPNCFPTGGSLSSENVCIGVRKCCEQILKNIAPIRDTLENPTWEKLISAAWVADVELHALGTYKASEFQPYSAYGVCLAEVEIDVLTGEFETRRVDLIEDVGQSISPEIDIGQVEGAFIMALGYWTCENLVYSERGSLLTDRAWTYPVPQARDIPEIFNIYFQKNSYSHDLNFGSKCAGEPPSCLAVAVPLAIREALVEARKENHIDAKKWFDINGPYSVANIGLATETTTENLVFY